MDRLRIAAVLLFFNFSLVGRAAGPPTRIEIGQLLRKFDKPVVYPYLLDSDHLLLEVNGKCHGARYGCELTYLMVDRTGKELASLPFEISAYIEPLVDGHLALRDKNSLKILDEELATVAEYPCGSGCEFPPSSAHIAATAVVRSTDCYFRQQCGEKKEQSPLTAKARTLGGIYLLPVSPQEVWFMDKHTQVSYLTAGRRPVSVPGSKRSVLPTDGCTFDLYRANSPRILASCPEGVPLGPDDAIGIQTDVAVYDVLTRKTVARRTGGGYFLSLDGHTLGRLQHNEFIELEPLP